MNPVPGPLTLGQIVARLGGRLAGDPGVLIRQVGSLDQAAAIPDVKLVLPAHGKPFRGAHERLQALIDEHLHGLAELEALCREPKRAVDA